jgi:hypothetical protein
MAERVSSPAAAAAAFETFAAAEGHRIPFYARLCSIVAARPELHGLLLRAPTGQRLPVLLLAALHDVVLRHRDAPLARWFPSVNPDGPLPEDPTDALLATVDAYLGELDHLLRTRRIQTNEVNRCVGWHLGLAALGLDPAEPIALVELGASAGLNRRLADYAVELRRAGSSWTWGRADSPVRLACLLRDPDGGGGPDPTWARTGPPDVVHAEGLDHRPLDASDPDDARWLLACTWPEQSTRVERLRQALALAATDPPTVTRGDVVDDLDAVLDRVPDDVHAVVLSSWVLAYLPRPRRTELLDRLVAAAARRRGPLSLLTLEADRVCPWVPGPDAPTGAPPEVLHASLLAVTGFGDGGVRAEPIARCQAHLAWAEPLGTADPAASVRPPGADP